MIFLDPFVTISPSPLPFDYNNNSFLSNLLFSLPLLLLFLLFKFPLERDERADETKKVDEGRRRISK